MLTGTSIGDPVPGGGTSQVWLAGSMPATPLLERLPCRILCRHPPVIDLARTDGSGTLPAPVDWPRSSTRGGGSGRRPFYFQREGEQAAKIAFRMIAAATLLLATVAPGAKLDR